MSDKPLLISSPPFVYLPVCVVSIDGYIDWRWPDSWSQYLHSSTAYIKIKEMNKERPEAWAGCSYKRETKWITRRSQQMKRKVGAEELEKKENKKEDLI